MKGCPICAQSNLKILDLDVPGYVQGTSYVVYECSNCETQFIKDKYDKKIYDLIYGQKGDFGYDRYSKYAEEIKAREYPLGWLALKEPAYLYVEEYLRHKKPLLILEVGCGEGYLTYAMKQSGHQVTGIDVSEQAISRALKAFGLHYKAVDIKDYKPLHKFDLIVCTETIEHLQDPVNFVSECKRLLKPEGEILLTTPNKDYRTPGTTWQTEAPPVHRFWMGHKSFEKIAEKLKLSLTFLPLVMPMDMERNNIIAYLMSRGNNKFGAVLDKEGKVIQSKPSWLRQTFRDLAMWTPVRYFCNGMALYATKIVEPPTLGVVLR